MKLVLLISCLVLYFVFAGGLPASAYTLDKVQTVPTVVNDNTINQSLGTILLKEEYARSIEKGNCMSISLPSYIELKDISVFFLSSTSYLPYLQNATVASATYEIADYSNLSPGTTVDLAPGTRLLVEDKNRFSLQITENLFETYDTVLSTAIFRCYINFDSVKIKSSAPEGEEVQATLAGTGGFSSSLLTVAKIASSSGGTTSLADAPPPNITDQGGSISTITISENVAGSLVKNDTDYKNKNTVKLVLPAGLSWNTVNLLPSWGFSTDDIDYTVGVDTGGYSVLYLIINNETTSSGGEGRIIIQGDVTVDESIAQTGKVDMRCEGTNPGFSSVALTVANYSVSGGSIKAKTSTDIFAGHINQSLGEFTVSEGIEGDLAVGRTITLTLSDGARWYTFPTAVKESGDCELSAPVAVGDDGQVIKYTVTGASSDKSVFCFKYATVNLAVSAPEQIEISVGGSGGLKGNLVVAYVIAPLKLSAGKAEVSAGIQSQDIGELIISEDMPGALRAKDATGSGAVLELTLPNGVTFEKLPKVEITEGNIILDHTDIKLAKEDRRLVIEVENSSTIACVIKVSDISLNINRMIPEGDVKLEVAGTAISETGHIFSGSLNRLEVVLATCITAAPSDVKTSAVFTIGNNSYELNGEKQEMDIAPYIKDERTYGPVRYIGYALGLCDQEIFWDEATQTVTFMRDKRVIQFKVGRASILMQGTEVPIDVAPELVDPGRVMLPYRWVASVLDGSVLWSEEKQQITVQNTSLETAS